MGGTRALFASIGVSVSLVAAAALSLLAVSVVIAFGGWPAGLGESGSPVALVLAGAAPTKAEDASSRHAAPIVLAARPRHRAALPGAPVATKPVRAAEERVARRRFVSKSPAVEPAPAAPAPVATPAPKKQPAATGEAVRGLGDGLSSTAQNTGKALGEVTEPLSPPVSSAVQKVADLAAGVLQRTTNGLGSTLDTLGRAR